MEEGETSEEANGRSQKPAGGDVPEPEPLVLRASGQADRTVRAESDESNTSFPV